MFSIFKKKIIIPHVRMTGVIGSVGRFKQGIDLANQQEILKKAFSFFSTTIYSTVTLFISAKLVIPFLTLNNPDVRKSQTPSSLA